jgi:hypothetical protein
MNGPKDKAHTAMTQLPSSSSRSRAPAHPLVCLLTPGCLAALLLLLLLLLLLALLQWLGGRT